MRLKVARFRVFKFSWLPACIAAYFACVTERFRTVCPERSRSVGEGKLVDLRTCLPPLGDKKTVPVTARKPTISPEDDRTADRSPRVGHTLYGRVDACSRLLIAPRTPYNMLFMRIIHRREISSRSTANPAGGLRTDKAQLASPKNEAAALSAGGFENNDGWYSVVVGGVVGGWRWAGEDLDRSRKIAVVVRAECVLPPFAPHAAEIRLANAAYDLHGSRTGPFSVSIVPSRPAVEGKALSR